MKQKKKLSPAYAARIKRGKLLAKEAGIPFSLSQIRGHAKPGEKSIKAIRAEKQIVTRASTLNKYAAVMKRLAGGQSLAAATRAEKTTTRTVLNIGARRGDFTGKIFNDRYFTVYTANGIIHESVQVDKTTASILGKYHELVKKAHKSDAGKKELLTFKPRTIKDLHGKEYKLALKYETLAFMGVGVKGKNTEADDASIPQVVYRLERKAA